MQLNFFAAKLRKTRSGDDFMMTLDLGVGGVELVRRVRLRDIKAPDPHRQEEGAEDVRVMVHNLLSSSDNIIVEVIREIKTNVVLGRVYFKAGGDKEYTSLNNMLIDMGYEYKT